MVGIRLFDINKNTVGVLELDGQTDTTFEENSALFSDGIPSGFSAPGTIPNTPHNNAILQNAHILKRLEYIMVYKCEVVRDNVPVYQGDFLLLEATNTTIQYSIAINGFNTSVFDKRLKDYDWPVTTIIGPEDDTIDIVNFCSDKCKTIDWREGFTFPVYSNPELYGEGSTSKNPHYEGIVNEWDDATQTLKYNTTDGSPSSEDEFIFNKYTLVPWFYIKWLLKTIAEMEGYTIGGTALNAAEFEKLTMPNNYTLDKKSGLNYYVRASADTPNVFPTPVPTLPYTMAIVFDDETTSPNEDNSSSWNPSNGRYTIKKAGYHYFTIYLQFTLSWATADFTVLVKRSDGTVVYSENVTNLNNNPAGQPGGQWYDMTIDFNTYAANSNIGQYFHIEILYHSISLLPGGTYEVVGYIQVANNSYKSLNVYSSVIDPKNHVPDITVGDLILMLRDVYCLNIDFDRTLRKLLVTFAEDDLKSQPIEVTPGNNPHLSSGLTVPEEYIFRYIDSTQYKYLWDFGQDKKVESFLTVDRAMLYPPVELETDLDDDAPIGTICFVELTQAYYVRRDETPFPDIKWFFHSYAYQEYQTGIKPTDKAPICSPMVTVVQRVPGESYSRMITQIIEQGTSLAFDTGENEPSVKICYWHGRQYNNTGYLYPMATSGSRDYTTGALITTHYDGTGPGQYAPVVIMEWEYLFNAFWLSFYQLMQAPHEVEMQALATLGFLRGLNLSKPITINYITYVLKTLRYPLLNSGHIPTTLIMARKTPAL
jgi:hypothetical protein